MQTTGEDYYDIPEEWVPSANFAARPTSEISELSSLDIDGLWTFTNFSSSSSNDTDDEDDIDDGPTPTALSPETTLIPEPSMPDRPDIMVTAPSRRQSLRQKIRSIGGVATNIGRPTVKKNAEMVPSDAFESPDHAPQLPRRAISARIESREAAKERYSRRLSFENDWNVDPVLDMESRESKDKTQRSLDSTKNIERTEENRESAMSQTKSSFSRKPRVREALERKKLTRLRMDFVGSEPEKYVDSPQSMLGTPLELYAIPEREPGRFRPTSAIHGRRGSSTPVSPKAPSPFLRLQPQSNDTLEDDEAFEDLYQTRVYMPGPICLEKHPAMLRKDSVATLDPFASEVDSIGRRPSDLRALAQIVVYFDGMGIMEEATDQCLDRYWLTGQRQPQPPPPPLNSEFEVLELEPLSPRSQQSRRSSRDGSSLLSRFSFSSASSSASVPQETPQKRQLIRLRRLLSPALPGLKGSEN
ncbi:hypothetical protein N0V94_005900 [Neodidymelliopsis sp. IMI 364377]|nr:hypothetical protein N0V94_005900 [Neodidymelliopsis sp. IMI 364377]